MKKTVFVIVFVLTLLFSACAVEKEENVIILLDADVVSKADHFSDEKYELQFNQMMELIDTIKESDFCEDISYQLYMKIHGVNISDGVSTNDPALFLEKEIINLIEEGKTKEIITNNEYFKKLTDYYQRNKDKYFVLCGINSSETFDKKEGIIRPEDNHSSKVAGRWLTEQEIKNGEMVCSINNRIPLIFEEYVYGSNDNAICVLDYNVLDGKMTDIHSYSFKIIGHYILKERSDDWDYRIYVPEKVLLNIYDNHMKNTNYSNAVDKLMINSICIRLQSEKDINKIDNLIRQVYPNLEGVRLIRR